MATHLTASRQLPSRGYRPFRMDPSEEIARLLTIIEICPWAAISICLRTGQLITERGFRIDSCRA